MHALCAIRSIGLSIRPSCEFRFGWQMGVSFREAFNKGRCKSKRLFDFMSMLDSFVYTSSGEAKNESAKH